MTTLDLDDLDAIRRPTPQLDRVWLIGIALIAVGGFASGFLNQVVGPLRLEPPAEVAAPDGVAAVQPLAPAAIQPSMQVAAARPEPSPPPKPEVAEDIAPEPAAPTVAATTTAAPIEAAPAVTSVVPEAPVAPPPNEPAPPAEEPPAA